MVSELDKVAPDFFWFTTMAVLAEASAAMRHAESAGVIYKALAPYADYVVQVGYAGSFGPVSRLLGRLAAAQGDLDSAVAHLESARSMAEAAGLRLYETQARDELEQLATASA
jgi:hypothetical protein